MPISNRIAIDRALTREEYDLVTWLLANATESGRRALPQLPRARVSARCGCGCGCIDFRVEDAAGTYPPAGIEIVSDFWWRTGYGHLCGAFVFLVGGRLTGLDLWSIDGGVTPNEPPQPYELWPYQTMSALVCAPRFLRADALGHTVFTRA